MVMFGHFSPLSVVFIGIVTTIARSYPGHVRTKDDCDDCDDFNDFEDFLFFIFEFKLLFFGGI